MRLLKGRFLTEMMNREEQWERRQELRKQRKKTRKRKGVGEIRGRP